MNAFTLLLFLVKIIAIDDFKCVKFLAEKSGRVNFLTNLKSVANIEFNSNQSVTLVKLSKHLKGQLEPPVSDKKSSLPVSWNPP